MVLQEVAAALAYMHSNEITHNDMKSLAFDVGSCGSGWCAAVAFLSLLPLWGCFSSQHWPY